MSKSKNIIILVIVLGLLAGSYLFLANRPEPETEEPQSEKVTILDFDKNEITKMELKSINGELTFNKVEKEVEEEKDGEKQKVTKSMWEVEYPHEIELKQMSVDDIAYSFASLQAERVIEEERPDDLAAYGLEEPQAVAQATLKDGSKQILYLGDRTPSGNTYYLMMEGDPKVYEVWMNHGQHFLYTLSDVRDRSLPAINSQDVTYFIVDKGDDRPIEIKRNNAQSDEEAQFGIGAWYMPQPYKEPMGVSGNRFQELIDGMPALSIEDFVEDGVEDFAKYGLEDPSLELIIKDSENTLHLLFGNEYDEDKIYFRTLDTDSVYGMKKSNIEFAHVKPFDLVEKFAYIVNIENVDKLEIEGRGKSYTLTLSRETQEAENEDEEDEVITTYMIDGKEVEKESFTPVYQSVIGIIVDAENTEELVERPEIKTTFYLNKGSNREVHISYVPYDNDFYAVFRGGNAEFLVHKDSVHNMLKDVENLAQFASSQE